MTERFSSIKEALQQRWRPRRTGQFLILDNRDSFVFNLAHRLAELGEDCAVVRSDAVTLQEIEAWQPAALVLSPGPGHPCDAGITIEAIRHFAPTLPMLGVCLGHQALACAFGGRVEPGNRPQHGMASPITHTGQGLFNGLQQGFSAARYHSLVVSNTPSVLVETAWCDGFVMGLEHRDLPLFGVQFHPESILTEVGLKLLGNFVDLTRQLP